MFQRILVPLDGSPFAEEALKYAAEVCRGELRLIRIQPYPSVTELPLDLPVSQSLLEAEQNASTAYLESKVTELKKGGFQKVSSCQKLGDPAACILEEVRDYEPDCVVISSHGRSGLRRFLLGSVAERVARHAHCPVLLVRPQESAVPAR